MTLTLAEYSKQVKLAIALNDKRGLEILINNYIVTDTGATLKRRDY